MKWQLCVLNIETDDLSTPTLGENSYPSKWVATRKEGTGCTKPVSSQRWISRKYRLCLCFHGRANQKYFNID